MFFNLIKIIFLLPILFFVCSCSDNTGSLNSEVEFAHLSQASREGGQEFFLSNDSKNLSGQAVYLHVITGVGQSFLLPPAQYGTVRVSNTIVEGFNMDSGCVKVLEKDFPVTISVCDSAQCSAIKNVVDIHTPGHYNFSGVGGLVIPEIYPESPCSERLVDHIENDAEFTQL